MRIDYEQTRSAYRRSAYDAERGATEYKVGGAKVGATKQRFSQVVEAPDAARDVHFYASARELPAKYRHALQAVR